MRLKPTSQPSGLYHVAIGDFVVTAVNDGTFQATFDMIAGVDRAECERIERAAFRPVPPKMTMNSFLLEMNGRLALVDSGCGKSMGNTLGMACRNLAAMNVAPQDIDIVLVTHLHPDHINGLVDENDEAMFPNAELWVNETELDFFLDPDSPSRSPDGEPQDFFPNFRRVTKSYIARDRIRTVKEGPVMPGVTAVTQPGHTPGQTAWVIESQGDAVMIWGDVVHMPNLQFAAPEAATILDVDRDQAVATRRRTLDMVSATQMRVAGIHMDFPTFGYVEKRGSAYAFVPELWRAVV